MPFGNVRAFNENRGNLAQVILDRLIDEIQIAGFKRAARSTLQNDPHVGTDEGLTAGEHVIQKFVKALALDLWNSLAHRTANDIPMADQLMVR